MTSRRLSIISTALVLALSVTSLTTAARASTTDLLSRANTLTSQYGTLAQRIAGCPAGNCTDEDAILSVLASLHGQLLDLEQDRAAVGLCGDCFVLDVTLAGLHATDQTLISCTHEWDEWF
jgi:hypothetical protein